MSYPQFSKSGLTSLVFTRGDLFPVRRVESYSQIVAESEAHLVRIATLAPPVILHSLRFEGLTLADYTALRAWVRHPAIRGRANTFTYTNTLDQSFTVRWWQDTFDMPQTNMQRYSVDILLREEGSTW